MIQWIREPDVHVIQDFLDRLLLNYVPLKATAQIQNRRSRLQHGFTMGAVGYYTAQIQNPRSWLSDYTIVFFLFSQIMMVIKDLNKSPL